MDPTAYIRAHMGGTRAYAPCPCRFHDLDEIGRRFPLLLRAMRWVAILSHSEAQCAIRDYKHGWCSGEAVSHFAGAMTPAAPVYLIKRAIEARHAARFVYAERREIIARLDVENVAHLGANSAA